MAQVGDDSLSKNFFEHSYQLRDMRQEPLTNVYWSCTDRASEVYGTVYFIHGYGGSPVEPCLKVPMMHALSSGFDVVALEGVDFSATCGNAKNIDNMTLMRQKKALRRGLAYCRRIPDLSHKNNIAWAHSMSCRALSDLMVDSVFVRNYFSSVVLNNPYMMAPDKVMQLKQRLVQVDPTGKKWNDFTQRTSVSSRNIESHSYQVPTRLRNLLIPLPPNWDIDVPDFKLLARRMSYFIGNLYVYFVLGTGDNMSDYNQNMQFFLGLKNDDKELVCINGANHSFENAIAEYERSSSWILETIKRRKIYGK